MSQGRHCSQIIDKVMPRSLIPTGRASRQAPIHGRQEGLRHSTLRITLETHVLWWPKKQRCHNAVGTALREAGKSRQSDSHRRQDLT